MSARTKNIQIVCFIRAVQNRYYKDIQFTVILDKEKQQILTWEALEPESVWDFLPDI